MARVVGGRVKVRAEGDPQVLTLLVLSHELTDGTWRHECTLESGEECKSIDADTWQVIETGQVLRRADFVERNPGSLHADGPPTA